MGLVNTFMHAAMLGLVYIQLLFGFRFKGVPVVGSGDVWSQISNCYAVKSIFICCVLYGLAC